MTLNISPSGVMCALVLLTIDQHTKFELPSFTFSGSRDLTTPF